MAEPVVEETFTIDPKIPEALTEVISKSAVVPDVEMVEEPKVPIETDIAMKEPAKPKAKAPSKRESKPEPEIPTEVSYDTSMWSNSQDLFSSSALSKFSLGQNLEGKS